MKCRGKKDTEMDQICVNMASEETAQVEIGRRKARRVKEKQPGHTSTLIKTV